MTLKTVNTRPRGAIWRVVELNENEVKPRFLYGWRQVSIW